MKVIYACFLNTQLCKRQFDHAVTGGTRPALDYDAIRATMILYPMDLTKQEQIVKNVYAIQERAESILKEATEKTAESERVLETWDLPFTSISSHDLNEGLFEDIV